MRLGEAGLRRSLNAICSGRDDRLAILLWIDPCWTMQREAMVWLRMLRAHYDDTLEIAVFLRHSRPAASAAEIGERQERPTRRVFRLLRRLNLPLVVTLAEDHPESKQEADDDTSDAQRLRHPGLYDALRIPFERWSLWDESGDESGFEHPAKLRELPTGLLMRWFSHDAPDHLATLTRQLFNSSDARRVILDLTPQAPQREAVPKVAHASAHEMAYEVARSILEQDSHIGGVSLGRLAQDRAENAAIDRASDHAPLQAALDALAYAVQQRRMTRLTRSPRSLRSGR